MNARWLPTRRELLITPWVFVAFLAALLPIMFLFSVIVGLDQYSQHRGLLAALQSHGREVDAVINQINPESGYGYIFLTFPEQPGGYDFAFIRNLSLYPSGWLESLSPGQPLRIRFVAAEPNEYAREAVPLDLYPQIRRSLGVMPDAWGLFGFFLLIAVVAPNFLFLGMLPLEELMASLIPDQILK